jgi:hypothetical protein
MADSDRDAELIRAHAAHAQRQALQHIQDEAANVAQTYQQQVARGDSSGAAWTLRQFASLVNEANVIAGAPAQQQQQAQQQPQQQYAPQPQLTEVEMQILREHPGIAADPKKLAEAKAAADALVTKNFHDPNYRNSPGYDSALRVALGLTASDGVSPGQEIASADAAVEATRGSKYARDFSRAEYDHLSNYRDELKKRGFYRMDDTP